MHLFVVDETNRDYVENQFFIVGGLVFTDEQAVATDALVTRIRTEAGFARGDSFKFHTNSRPASMDFEAWNGAKAQLLEGLLELGVRMIVYTLLHDIGRNQTYDVRMNFALNTILYAYDDLLFRDSAVGMFLLDRDNGRYDHLEHLFQHGLQFDGARNYRLDNRIKLFGMTNDNASHLSSAADIALGAFRYCVNTAGGRGRDEIARVMFPTLAGLIWGIEREDDVKQVGGLGFHTSPKRVGRADYRELYADLQRRLAEFADPQEPEEGTDPASRE